MIIGKRKTGNKKKRRKERKKKIKSRKITGWFWPSCLMFMIDWKSFLQWQIRWPYFLHSYNWRIFFPHFRVNVSFFFFALKNWASIFYYLLNECNFQIVEDNKVFARVFRNCLFKPINTRKVQSLSKNIKM